MKASMAPLARPEIELHREGGLPDPLDASQELGALVLVVIIASVLGWLGLCGAFVYKVWNERQMTHEYHEQAVQQKRIADALERRQP